MFLQVMHYEFSFQTIRNPILDLLYPNGSLQLDICFRDVCLYYFQVHLLQV